MNGLSSLKSTHFQHANANYESDKVWTVITYSCSNLSKDSETSWNFSVQIFWVNIDFFFFTDNFQRALVKLGRPGVTNERKYSVKQVKIENPWIWRKYKCTQESGLLYNKIKCCIFWHYWPKCGWYWQWNCAK